MTCAVPNCPNADEPRVGVCRKHRHAPKYCTCRKCSGKSNPPQDFASFAPVTLAPAPWDE